MTVEIPPSSEFQKFTIRPTPAILSFDEFVRLIKVRELQAGGIPQQPVKRQFLTKLNP